MNNDDVIYIDFSTISVYNLCREKARLRYQEDLQPLVTAPPLEFGGAFHFAIQSFYDEIAKNPKELDPPSLREFASQQSKSAFVSYLKKKNSSLPVTMESNEKRSIERGLNLLEAYFYKWKNETLVNEIQSDTGKPYTEIGFALYLMTFDGHPVMYVGRIDRIMRSRIDNRLRIIETKTTSISLTQFVNQIRPNHQITGYHWACKELIHLDVAGTIWDCVFVSSRQPKISGNHWETMGIDMDKDFSRTETRRSQVDIDEFLFDLTETVSSYLTDVKNNKRRWARNAPGACFTYNRPCDYLDVCIANGNKQIIENKFKKEKWEPWQGIVVQK